MKKKILCFVLLMLMSIVSACGSNETSTNQTVTSKEVPVETEAIETSSDDGGEPPLHDPSFYDNYDESNYYDTTDPWSNHYVGTPAEEQVWSFTDLCDTFTWTDIMRNYRNWEETGVILNRIIVDGPYTSAEGDYMCYESFPDNIFKDYNKPIILKDLRPDKSYGLVAGDVITIYGDLDHVVSDTTPIINARYVDINNYDEGISFLRPQIPADVAPCYIGIEWYSWEDERDTVDVTTGFTNIKTVGYLNHGDKVLAVRTPADREDPSSNLYKSGTRQVWQYGRFLGDVSARCLYTVDEWEKANQEGVFDKQESKYKPTEEADEEYSEEYLYDDGWEDDYILPHSDSDIVSDEELAALDDTTLWYAKNEIYATHGRKFSNPELQEYFNSKSWYKPTVEPDDFDESVFNEFEHDNIIIIQEEIDRRNNQ